MITTLPQNFKKLKKKKKAETTSNLQASSFFQVQRCSKGRYIIKPGKFSNSTNNHLKHPGMSQNHPKAPTFITKPTEATNYFLKLSQNQSKKYFYGYFKSRDILISGTLIWRYRNVSSSSIHCSSSCPSFAGPLPPVLADKSFGHDTELFSKIPTPNIHFHHLHKHLQSKSQDSIFVYNTDTYKMKIVKEYIFI